MLINNAGVVLTWALLPALAASPRGGVVVNVTSMSMGAGKRYKRLESHSVSTYCNAMYGTTRMSVGKLMHHG